MRFILKGKRGHGGCFNKLTANKNIRVADFLLSSFQIATHSAGPSRNIHSSLSLPISRCSKMQQLVLSGTLKGILWDRQGEAG